MSEEERVLVRHLMKSWDMKEEVISKFIESGMDLFAMENIDDVTLTKMIPIQGQLVRFKAKRAKWIKDGALPPTVESQKYNCPADGKSSSCALPDNFMEEDDQVQDNAHQCLFQDEGSQESTSAESSISEVPIVDRVVPKKHFSDEMSCIVAKKSKHYDLKNLLVGCKKGRDVLAYFQKFASLDEGYQNTLVEIIIDEEQKNDSMVKVSLERFDELANAIVNLFDGELKQTYLNKVTHADRAVTYGGKLYRRYYNERRKSSALGFGPKNKKPNSSALLDNESPGIADSEKHPQSILFVETNAKPQQEVMRHWKITAAERMAELKMGLNKKVDSYFRRFPGLLEEDGYLLLMSDFDFLHPEKGMRLLEEWPLLSDFIISSIRKKIDPDFLNDSTYAANEKILRVLSNISKLFSVVTVAKKAKGKREEWKASRAQAQDGFLLNIPAIAVLHEKLEEKRQLLAKFGLQQQPLAVVVGELESPSQYLVVVDNFHYCVDSPLRAIEVTFKIYQALDAKYPAEAEHIWLFIQKAVYGITTKSDRVYTSVTSRLGEYATYKKRANRN